MQRLWDVERAAGSSTLRAETLDALGGAGQVVADHLERAIEALTPDAAGRSRRGSSTTSSRRRARRSRTRRPTSRSSPASAGGEIDAVTAALADHRILRTDEGGRWEIFHDVLAGAVLGWKSRHDAERAVERAREEARRRHRRLAFLAFGALVALALATALAIFAFSQRSEARDQARVATGGQLVASALSLLDTDPELGLALALEAARVDPTPRAEDALRQSLAASRERGVIDVGSPARHSRARPRRALGHLSSGPTASLRLIDLAYGRRELVAPRRRSAPLRSLRTGAPCTSSRRRSLLVRSTRRRGGRSGSLSRLASRGRSSELVVEPKGTSAIVVAASRARASSRWRAVRPIGRVKQPPGSSMLRTRRRAAVVASGGADDAARLWDTRTWQRGTRAARSCRPRPRRRLRPDGRAPGHGKHRSDRSGLADGHRCARSRAVRAHRIVNDVAFSAEGVVVTASGDGTARTWGANGRPLQVLRGHDGRPVAAAFARPDVVVTAGADGTIRRLGPRHRRRPLRGRRSTARHHPPSESCRRTGRCRRDCCRQRRSAPVSRRGATLAGHEDVVNAVAFSPDGRLLVTAGRDHDVIVWDVATGGVVHRFDEAQSASVTDARFSPDGRWIVTAGPKSARLWTSPTAGRWRYLYGPKSLVVAAGFERDSRTLVTREEDGTVRRYVCELCGGLDELTALARSRLDATGRKPTEAERARYVG